MDDPKKKQCPHCKEFYSKNYLKTHIAKQHGISKEQQKVKKETRSYNVPSDFDPMSISLEEIDMPSDITSKIFTEKKIRNQPELLVQKKLEKKYGGTHQTTPAGIIDVITKDTVIEIKSWENWKHAIGQLMAYNYYYPNHMLKVHFFGKIPNDELKIVIITICTHYRIAVDWEK